MTDFELSAELTPVLARFLDQRSPIDVSRAGGAELSPLWPALVAEVGVVGLLVEERYDGQGASVLELAAAVHETARCGWSGPLVATAGVAVTLLQAIDPEDATGLRAAIASEGRVAVLAAHEDSRGVELAVTTTVRQDGPGHVVAGRKTFVDSGTHADTFLVPVADASGAIGIAVVDARAEGVAVRAMEAVDPGRGLAALELSSAPAVLLPMPDPEALSDAWLTGALLVAADQLGTAARVLDLSRAYAVEREQFGRKVASFQSVKHKLVDMFAELETARSMVRQALVERSELVEGWQLAASAAKARASDAAMLVVREGVQVHGGIGFTWEHEISHHFRRVTAARGLYGTPAEHRALVAARMGF